jgi:DNA-binding NtrC family response regulator
LCGDPRIPLNEQQAALLTARVQEGNGRMANSKILICDDEEGIRESLKLVLGDHYNLVAVDSGDMALEVLSKAKDIKLMLLDIKMPKTNGLDVLQEIKKKFPKIKIIMVTGYKSVETAAEATRLGASGYIVKPFKSQEILETVKKNLEP